jgi:hypothetical protein
MQKYSIGIPFRGGQEIHVSTMGVLIQACFPQGSLVVGMNSLISNLSKSISNLVCNFFFCAISHSYHIALFLQEIIFALVNLLVVLFLYLNQMTMFMKRWSSPFWKKLNFRLILRCLLMAPHIPHLRRDWEWISIVSKFKFIASSVACSFVCILFQVSHFILMFYVFYRNTQPFASPFVPFYVRSDFFLSSTSCKSLLEYVEGIAR